VIGGRDDGFPPKGRRVIAHLSYVMCDRCGNPAEACDDAKEARELAKMQGFVRLGRGKTAEDLCRDCAVKAGQR
jgi:hypothetical protein